MIVTIRKRELPEDIQKKAGVKYDFPVCIQSVADKSLPSLVAKHVFINDVLSDDEIGDFALILDNVDEIHFKNGSIYITMYNKMITGKLQSLELTLNLIKDMLRSVQR